MKTSEEWGFVMVESSMRWVTQLVVIGVAMGAVAGCGREPAPVEGVPVEPETSVAVEIPVAPAESDAPEPAKSPFPKAELPPHLEKTKDMPAGRAKAKVVEYEFLKTQLPKLQEQVVDGSRTTSELEKEARHSDPALGKLYKELVDARLAYQQALAANAAYAEAKAKQADDFLRYQKLVERQELLKKEISDEHK
ncbi:MAG: hypothetical protein HN341_06730 [Verrucomicrobia bacterium]|nr:hypothetical protein [Verrucomicrobiota bacterium]